MLHLRVTGGIADHVHSEPIEAAWEAVRQLPDQADVHDSSRTGRREPLTAPAASV
ncbi:hypothetical protein [Streptomyces phaeolivaceus]|uniref:hypothetical protein n=1 Tax=Streptomyces phaeolivaceus TaxID=2653200 RepID=UPI00186A482D|nr:hypothetical protein [Streptomyces phaeolivaceus]